MKNENIIKRCYQTSEQYNSFINQSVIDDKQINQLIDWLIDLFIYRYINLYVTIRMCHQWLMQLFVCHILSWSHHSCTSILIDRFVMHMLHMTHMKTLPHIALSISSFVCCSVILHHLNDHHYMLHELVGLKARLDDDKSDCLKEPRLKCSVSHLFIALTSHLTSIWQLTFLYSSCSWFSWSGSRFDVTILTFSYLSCDEQQTWHNDDRFDQFDVTWLVVLLINDLDDRLF